MKRIILLLYLALGASSVHSQYDERYRLVSNNPIRKSDGSFMQSNNLLYYNYTTADSTWLKKRLTTATSDGDAYAFRVKTMQALRDLNTVQLNWTSVQRQPDADRFQIEQSPDAGITWKTIGTVPASKFQSGIGSYNFVFNKAMDNIDVRVAAVNAAQEKRYSSTVRTTNSGTNLLSVDNLVFNTAHIRIGSTKTQNVKMTLINSSGVPVQTLEPGLTEGVNSVNLDMSTLVTGVYTLAVTWPGDMLQSVKLIKQ